MEKYRVYEILQALSKGDNPNMTSEEFTEFISLLKNNNSEIINSWIEMKYNESEKFEKPNQYILDEILLKIKKDIKEKQREKTHVRVKQLYLFFQRAAAILIIPLLAIAIYLITTNKSVYHPVSEKINVSNEDRPNLIGDTLKINRLTTQEFISPSGTRSKIILTDSTEVWLNSSSSLLIENDFGKSDRRVKLVGEAFFNVRKNKVIPFIVEVSDKMKIFVKGTRFSVNAYPENENIETVLVSGSINLVTNRKSVNLIPSQKAVINKLSDNLSISSVNNDKYNSWKDGILVFNETPMSEIISTLEKWYNVRISVKDDIIMKYKFTARLDNCSLMQVLDYFSFSSPIKYSIKEKDVQISIKP